MKIELDWKSCIILILSMVLLLVGVYKYRDMRMVAMAQQIQQTQLILSQLQFPRNVAVPLKQLGWEVKEQASQPAKGGEQ